MAQGAIVEKRMPVFWLTTMPSFAAIAHLGASKRVFHFGNPVPFINLA
ncbi:hypothetical protein QUB61_35650 [Microcoleus sp. C2D2]